jgi:S1-C subfamily serine protease
VLGALAAVAAIALLAGTAVGIALTGRSTTSETGIGGGSAGSQSGDGGTGGGSQFDDFGSANSTTSTDVNVRKIATSVSPAIVNIASTLSNGDQTAGSGVVITASGEVLTNNHVINGATEIVVEVGVTQDKYQAKVLGYDVGDDVALLQLEDAPSMKTIKTADSSSVSRNDAIVAIGNALGRFGPPSVVTGTVTALHQGITAGDGMEQETLEDMIRIAASIQPGDSGGALVNLDGQVIGINTAADTGGGRFGFQSGTTGFAIPIEKALAVARQIQSGDATAGVHIGDRAMLGVVLATADEGFGSTAGAAVTDVGSGSAAESAGIGAGDTITALGGRTVRSSAQLRAALDDYQPDDRVRVTWTDSSGETNSATVTLTKGPPA